jgi:hypothetical protein
VVSRALAEDVAEAVEAVLPRRSLEAQPLLGAPQAGWIDLAGADASGLLRPNQLARLEHLQVLDRGRNRHAEEARQLAHRGRAAGQALDDRPPVGIGDRVEHLIRDRRLMVKHVLNGKDVSPDSQVAA